jgi:hypothetical protein
MASEQENRAMGELLDQQEKVLSDQMKRHDREIARLRRKRRWRIILRSLALFCGVVLVLFGIITLIVVRSMHANFNNVFVFTLSELVAFPFLRFGIVLFQKMPVEQELTTVAEQLVETQDSLAHVREERLKLIRGPVKTEKTNITPLQGAGRAPGEQLISFDKPSAVCPECGQSVREGMKICRNCGHLFI